MLRPLLFGLLILSSCCRSPSLTCRSEYLYPLYLASTQVNTPDPACGCFLGQQIIVRWNLPRHYLPSELLLTVRFGDHQIKTFSHPIPKRKGYWIYRLINQDYTCRGGIISFQAQLIQDGQVLDHWDHYLWADIIEIN